MGKHATIELQDPQGVNMITQKDHPENNPNILSVATELLGMLLELSLHLPIYSRNAFKKITSHQLFKKSTLIKDHPPSNPITWSILAKKTSICKASLNIQTPKRFLDLPNVLLTPKPKKTTLQMTHLERRFI